MVIRKLFKFEGAHRAELFFTPLPGEHSWTFVYRGSIHHVRQAGPGIHGDGLRTAG